MLEDFSGFVEVQDSFQTTGDQEIRILLQGYRRGGIVDRNSLRLSVLCRFGSENGLVSINGVAGI